MQLTRKRGITSKDALAGFETKLNFGIRIVKLRTTNLDYFQIECDLIQIQLLQAVLHAQALAQSCPEKKTNVCKDSTNFITNQ